jgi:hypothetical protein
MSACCCAAGVAHNPWRLPSVLGFAGAAWPCCSSRKTTSSKYSGTVFWLALRFRKAAHFASVSSFRTRLVAVAVGQFAASIAAIVPRGMLLRLNCDLPTEFLDSLTLIVGQDEDALSLVRCADFRRAEYSPRRLVTNLFQLSNDLSESEGDVSFDILEIAESGAKKSNSVCDERPEVARVFGAEPLSGCGEGLAGIAPSEDVHAVSKCSPWEGFKIRPDRCRVHESRFHF